MHRNNFDTSIQLPKKDKIEDIFRISSSIHFENKFSETELLGNICFVSYGLRPNSDERFWKGEFKKEDLISNKKDKDHPKEYVEAEFIDRYRLNQIKYLGWGTDRSPSKLVRRTFPELYDRPKLIRGRTTDAIYDHKNLICNDGCVLFVPFHSLKNVENRSINNSIQKWNQKERTDLEKISKNFDLKYLLAILNSKFAKFYLNTIRRHRIEYYFYPDDLKQLPIKKLTLQEQKPFIQKVDTMISKSQKLLEKKEEFLTIELRDTIESTDREIDSMVYKLYGLIKEELRMVDPSL